MPYYQKCSIKDCRNVRSYGRDVSVEEMDPFECKMHASGTAHAMTVEPVRAAAPVEPLTPEQRAAVNATVEHAKAWQKLTPAEQDVCERMDMSPEAFLAHKAKLTALGGRRQ